MPLASPITLPSGSANIAISTGPDCMGGTIVFPTELLYLREVPSVLGLDVEGPLLRRRARARCRRDAVPVGTRNPPLLSLRRVGELPVEALL